MKHKIILALVGMPGAGKTEVAEYLSKKDIPFIRFGQFIEDGVKKLNLPLTADNERRVREKIRVELGMGALAIKAKPRIEEMLRVDDVIVIDGLYSWEEYTILKKEFPGLIVVHIYAEPYKRYERLRKRAVRPLSFKAYERDVAELEKLNKGGPIAIADYLVENNGNNIKELYQKADQLLARLKVRSST